MRYPNIALSDTAIRNAKPLDKAFKLYDEAGLFMQITPSGGKLWCFKYRFDGKEKFLAVGSYPEVTLASARERRGNARKLLASEPPVDLSENRQNEKAEKLANKSNTFELWAKKWWRFTLQILSTLAIDHPASVLHIRD